MHQVKWIGAVWRKQDTILVQGKAEALYLVRAGVQNIQTLSFNASDPQASARLCPLCILVHITWKHQWCRMALVLPCCLCLLQYPLVSSASGLFCTWQLRAGKCLVQCNWMMWYCFPSSWCLQLFLGPYLSSPSSKPLREMIAHIAKMKALCLSNSIC